jgi:putative resolvase
MKLTQWAKQNHIHYRTALNWFHAGQLPVPARQLETGTIWVDDVPLESKVLPKVALYARVSSHDQKADLDRQVARLLEWSLTQGLQPNLITKDIGSGLNNRRRGLRALLSDASVSVIIVEHKDRLARWGFEFIEAALHSRRAKILVMNPGDIEQDLVRDLIDVATSVCARVYGKRSAKNKAEAWAKKLVSE